MTIGKTADSWQGMLLVSFLFSATVLSPVLFGGRIFYESDLVNWVYPIYHFYQDALAGGESIFFNPNNFSGFPTFIASNGFLSPIHYFVFQLLPAFTAYNLLVLANVSLGLFFVWSLVKKFGLPSWIAFLSGLAYVFGQWLWIHDLTVANALPILPLLFLMLWQISRGKNNWYILWSSLIIGYGFYAVHFNWLAMILAAGFLFSVYLGWSEEKKWLTPSKFLLMVLAGALLGALIIWPSWVYGNLSSRAAGELSYQEAAGGAIAFGDLARYLLPYFKIQTFGITNSPAQLYLGVLPLFFILFALGIRLSLARFFVFLFFLCLLVGIKYSPVFWLMHQLPVLDTFRAPHRWMFIGSFAAAILAGFGLRSFWQGENEQWSKKLLKIFQWLGWLGLILLLVASVFFTLARERIILWAQSRFVGSSGVLPLEHYRRVMESMFEQISQSVNLFAPRVFLPLLFIFLGWLTLKYFRKKWAVLAVVALNFLFVFLFYQPTISQSSFVQKPATVGFIENQIDQLEPDAGRRIFSFLPGFGEYVKLAVPHQPSTQESFIFQSNLLAPNTNLIYGLESVDYYDNLMSRPMSRVLALIGSDRATIGSKLSDLEIAPDDKAKLLGERKKLLDLLGARYIISVFPLDEGIFSKIFETKIPPYDIPIYVYEDKEARPLFYFAEAVEMIEPGEIESYQKLLRAPLAGRSAFIECRDCPVEDFDGQGEAVLQKRTNDAIMLETESARSQWLVLSQNYLPGWRAYLDGQEAEIYRVNTVCMAVLAPAGQHRISFKYSPYKR